MKEALKYKAPSLHKHLKKQGKLEEYAEAPAEEIGAEVSRLSMEMCRREKWDSLCPVECARRLAMADALKRELVLAEMLEFPPEPTSLLNRDETTDSDPMT